MSAYFSTLSQFPPSLFSRAEAQNTLVLLTFETRSKVRLPTDCSRTEGTRKSKKKKKSDNQILLKKGLCPLGIRPHRATKIIECMDQRIRLGKLKPLRKSFWFVCCPSFGMPRSAQQWSHLSPFWL